MTLIVQWYDRKDDYTPDFGKLHTKSISGNSAADCMAQYREFYSNHDCAKYTLTEIVYVHD